jgi:hypothetical protein
MKDIKVGDRIIVVNLRNDGEKLRSWTEEILM